MRFTVVPRSHASPKEGIDEAFLRVDHWNDYSFVTMFDVTVFDSTGNMIELGAVKIGFSGQTTSTATHSTLPQSFENLGDKYFSVGLDVDYYKKLNDLLTPDARHSYLIGIRDIVGSEDAQIVAAGEEVFRTSLLRTVSISAIEDQFRRVLSGGAPLTDFDFWFDRPQGEKTAGIKLNFLVKAGSTPSTNIHAIIGRNGVGKTTLLNEMILAIMNPDKTGSRFEEESWIGKEPISRNYFSSLVSVSFSAFDPFSPPQEQPDPERGTRYYYIGLKDSEDASGSRLKSLPRLRGECLDSLIECFSDRGKRDRWRAAITTLQSDENFEQMDLCRLADMPQNEVKSVGSWLIERMSSGHAVVLLTISRLVAKVEEKTLVLLDEPESHLHPPLLSAFTRALSQLLHDRNGVAIIATHSPVVLQEVPRSCGRVITRSRLSMHAEPPRLETFGENVGVLTREVFGLEVSKSGYHSLLASEVVSGKSYDEIISAYSSQVGLEARGILRAMIAERESSSLPA